MYNSYSGYNNYGSTSSVATSTGNAIWIIVAIVIALIGGIALYFTFLSKKNENKFQGFLGWMYSFLTFKKLLAENLLRITYTILAIFITLYSFTLVNVGFFAFILVLVIGNLLLRIFFEFALIKLLICKNTTEINDKLPKNDNE